MKCDNCAEKCPQAETANEIAKGRMYATDEVIRLQTELQTYKDAEEQGKLYTFPCKIGDVIYSIHDRDIIEYTVAFIKITEKVIIIETKVGYIFNITDLGKFLFLSYDEAKQALTELR